MKALSDRQANACENALGGRCVCRCKGAFHGARRGAIESLPYGDPHSTAETCPECDGRGWRRRVSVQCYVCRGSGHVRRVGDRVVAA